MILRLLCANGRKVMTHTRSTPSPKITRHSGNRSIACWSPFFCLQSDLLPGLYRIQTVSSYPLPVSVFDQGYNAKSITLVFPAMAVYRMLDKILHTIYMKRADILRFLGAGWHHGEIVNGYTPFFWRKSLDISKPCFPMWTAMLRFLCDFGIHHASLSTGERQCSVFSSDFQRFRRYWTDMLRFFSRFQADFQLKSGWIEPRLVGGYAPFSPMS